MKTICWTILSAMVATAAIADGNLPMTNNVAAPAAAAPSAAAPAAAEPLATPAPASTMAAPQAGPVTAETNLPPKAVRRHHTAGAKKMFVEPPVSLAPGPAEVAAKNLNVRGQAGLKGEFITHLHEGETVNVIQQINLDKHKAGEPAQWAKIAFPTNAQVWVMSRYIDANKTVIPRKLNVRAGPSENYSVVGVLEHGMPVTEVTTKGNWTRIEPPQNAYAFVAAMYLKQEASGTAPTEVPESAETEPMTTNTVAEAAPIATETTMEETPAPEMVDTNMAEVDTNLPPPPPRRVTHEGFVRHVHSVIEPTAYELYDLKTGIDIDYLYTTDTNLNIGAYNDRHIVVTGTEALDPRWPRTPVLTVEKIIVVE
ncbi:MAG TPA: SH3 domain-containing protein [Verrucomicrobiae bacterium]|nr:SH3 domain-containing protein [Verrucomicrobiae bacterium]